MFSESSDSALMRLHVNMRARGSRRDRMRWRSCGGAVRVAGAQQCAWRVRVRMRVPAPAPSPYLHLCPSLLTS